MERDYRRREEEYRRRKKKSSVKKIVLITLLVIIALFAVMAVSAYTVFKTGYYGKTNYVKNTGYTVNRDIQPETYLDEEGNVQVETEATLDSDAESEVLSKHETALAELAGELQQPTGTYNLLLIGVDRRDDSWNGNSDVMMLITVNHDKKTIYMTSFLRDLYANIPDVGVRKLNAACAYGGAELCVETIKSNYGVEIDNYAMVDFNAMIAIVDALGGVDLELTEDEVSVANGYIRTMCEANDEPYEAHELTGSGQMHLDGYQAVGYARNRYSGVGSDFGRTERQRKVLIAIFEKAQAGGLGSLNTAVQSILSYVTHDIDEVSMLKLIAQLPGWMDYDVEQLHIPYDNEYYSQNEILIPNDMQDTISKLRATIYGE